MKIINLDRKTIAADLGKQGENNATVVRFVIPEDWNEPTAAFTVRVTRPGEEDAYVPEGLNVADGIVSWTVNSADTAIAGRGKAQICCVSNGRIVKSRTFITHISESVGVNNEVVSAPEQSVIASYLEMISGLAAGAQSDRNAAASSEQNAAQSASAANAAKQLIESQLALVSSEIREQVLTAVAQAVETGTISDLDTGFITTLKEIAHGLGFRVWLGTTAEFNALQAGGLLEANVLYIRTDDTSAQDIRSAIAALQSAVAALQTTAADSGWQTLTISSTQGGFSAPTSGNKIPSYRKIGNHVYIQGFVMVNMGEAGPPDVNSPFAQLPSEFVPSHFFYLHAPGQGAREAGVLVDQAGYLSMAYFKDSTGANVTSGEYWIQIDCDFLTD